MAFSRITAAGVFAFLAILSHSAAIAADVRETVMVDGRSRSFLIDVPAGAPPPGGFPVILAFHGGGMQGTDMARITRLDAVTEASHAIAIYPDGVDKHWNDGRSTIKDPQDDVGFVAALLDQVKRRYFIDSRRVFATGISNGALFSERLGCDLSSRIAGIAPVAGTLPLDIAPTCRPTRPIAVLQIDGTADPIMPYAGGPVQDFGGVGEGGLVTSVSDTSGFWARHNGCGPRGMAEPLPPIAPFDPTRILRMRYTACPASAPVTILSVMGGGHVWPGGAQVPRPRIIGRESRQIDASATIVASFLGLPLP